MKRIAWKKITVAATAFTVLVFCRAAVSLGRAYVSNQWRLPKLGEADWLAQWKAVLLPAIQDDPWVYIGFATAALAIIAWAMIPGKPRDPGAEPPADGQ